MICLFPSYDFGEQERKKQKGIQHYFLSKLEKVDFVLFAPVKIENSPVYKWLMQNTNRQQIAWNFDTVFLVYKDERNEKEMLVKRMDRKKSSSDEFWASISDFYTKECTHETSF